jgi:hypothetical protein
VSTAAACLRLVPAKQPAGPYGAQLYQSPGWPYAKSPASALQLQLLDISPAEAHGTLSCAHDGKLLTFAVASFIKWLGGLCVCWDPSADAAFGLHEKQTGWQRALAMHHQLYQ